ncbi:hypothetical protein SK141_0121 [Streptococcus oralis]|nr:hypothetical protein SK141_0121 [Streptococcus oralis]
MVPKPESIFFKASRCFRAVLFRMVPKQMIFDSGEDFGFRAVLFRMVPKH